MPSKGFEQSVVIKCSYSDYSQRRNQTAASLEVRTLVCVWGRGGDWEGGGLTVIQRMHDSSLSLGTVMELGTQEIFKKYN